ncbi:MAG: hypothetical protein AAFR61_28425 [Bacteroidota bacterium]
MTKPFQPHIVFLLLAALWSCGEGRLPVADIREEGLQREFTEAEQVKGRELIQLMEAASGGLEAWQALGSVSFVQEAEWYGRKMMSHWDTVPQQFRLESLPGRGDGKLTLLNGPTKGQAWELEGEVMYRLSEDGSRKAEENEAFQNKILYKNYWFQFPFRIGEAPFIAYAGPGRVGEITYERVYATWGSFEANGEYDQFLLYLHPETYQMEYLYFTVRDAFDLAKLHAHFTDFRQVDSVFSLPFAQYVRAGKPGAEGVRLHENHYLEISVSKKEE